MQASPKSKEFGASVELLKTLLKEEEKEMTNNLDAVGELMKEWNLPQFADTLREGLFDIGTLQRVNIHQLSCLFEKFPFADQICFEAKLRVWRAKQGFGLDPTNFPCQHKCKAAPGHPPGGCQLITNVKQELNNPQSTMLLKELQTQQRKFERSKKRVAKNRDKESVAKTRAAYSSRNKNENQAGNNNPLNAVNDKIIAPNKAPEISLRAQSNLKVNISGQTVDKNKPGCAVQKHPSDNSMKTSTSDINQSASSVKLSSSDDQPSTSASSSAGTTDAFTDQCDKIFERFMQDLKQEVAKAKREIADISQPPVETPAHLTTEKPQNYRPTIKDILYHTPNGRQILAFFCRHQFLSPEKLEQLVELIDDYYSVNKLKFSKDIIESLIDQIYQFFRNKSWTPDENAEFCRTSNKRRAKKNCLKVCEKLQMLDALKELGTYQPYFVLDIETQKRLLGIPHPFEIVHNFVCNACHTCCGRNAPYFPY